MVYKVHLKEWSKGWEIHIDGVGVTQCEDLNDVPSMAHDYIETVTGVKDAPLDIDVD